MELVNDDILYHNIMTDQLKMYGVLGVPDDDMTFGLSV